MAEESLESILNAFIEDAEAVSTQMTVEDKQKVTKAGADVFTKELESEYKANHYRHRQTGKDPHLADSVMAQQSHDGNTWHDLADDDTVVRKNGNEILAGNMLLC